MHILIKLSFDKMKISRPQNIKSMQTLNALNLGIMTGVELKNTN